MRLRASYSRACAVLNAGARFLSAGARVQACAGVLLGGWRAGWRCAGGGCFCAGWSVCGGVVWRWWCHTSFPLCWVHPSFRSVGAGCWVLASFSLGALGGGVLSVVACTFFSSAFCVAFCVRTCVRSVAFCGVLCGVLGMILCMVLWF